jgi:hypothetical protein
MPFDSILKPDGSIAIGIATGILVYAVYDHSLPDTATIHATDAGDINVEASRKKAAWASAGVLAAVTLLTKDVNVFVLGAVVLFALDMHARHANMSNPDTGALVSDTGYSMQLRSVSLCQHPGRL